MIHDVLICLAPARSGCERIERMVLETKGFIILSADAALARGMFSLGKTVDLLRVSVRAESRDYLPVFRDYSENPLVLKEHDEGRISGLQLNRKHNRKKSKRR